MTEFLDVPGGRIAYDVTGDGPLVVCLPGMGDVRGAYRFLAPRLVAAGYRVATADLRGHGESSAHWDSYGHSDLGADLLALIRHLGGPAVVVAHSFSPGAAVFAAAEAPEEVLSTVLIGPFATQPELNPLLELAVRLVVRSATLWGAFYTSLYPGTRPDDFAAYRAALKATLRESGRMAAVAAMSQPAARDADGHRARATQPSLIVMGTRDGDFPDPRAAADAMAAALAGPAEVAMIEGAGHYPHAQFPAETAAVVLPFLRATHAPAGRPADAPAPSQAPATVTA
ncbi:alpha/beta fold hydrolase [Allostreptomyces psammosilenae]|uniref:Pimeloyl-ACP methyl ester carboxylesterase n=1 Tax=Allostreptomyces psammosilenae TaxID=1892865 RepID=A0A852ZX00_9ACTN|nr:alpha/beta hydrolase [Allostreptomyces psammosilenae]NYI06217.1 pimeloyl-ACP methyl ester carboxylesterase [Allostreptomyces psammosilenae]